MNEKISLFNPATKGVLQASLDEMRRNLPIMMEYQALLAEMRKASFDAHVDHGFTPEQALELCKKVS